MGFEFKNLAIIQQRPKSLDSLPVDFSNQIEEGGLSKAILLNLTTQ
jgi:hypothetical protein